MENNMKVWFIHHLRAFLVFIPLPNRDNTIRGHSHHMVRCHWEVNKSTRALTVQHSDQMTWHQAVNIGSAIEKTTHYCGTITNTVEYLKWNTSGHYNGQGIQKEFFTWDSSPILETTKVSSVGCAVKNKDWILFLICFLPEGLCQILFMMKSFHCLHT